MAVSRLSVADLIRRCWLALGAVACGGGPDLPVDKGTADADTDTDTDTDTDADTDTDTDPTVQPDLCINELMPDNQRSLTDETAAYPDWIEIHNPGNAAVSLAGWTMTDDVAVPAKAVLDASLSVPAGGYLLLYADNEPTLGPTHLPFSLDSYGEYLALIRPDGDGTSVTYGAIGADRSAARVPDCCAGSESCWKYPFGGTAGRDNAEPGAISVVLAATAEWRYWDQGIVPGIAWHTPAFDDAEWPIGPAPLGYGDSPTTQIGFGPDPLNRYVTTWFRTEFSVADASAVTAMRLRLRRDDGAGVFVNGFGVYWSNLPNELGADQLALTDVAAADEQVWLEGTVWPGALVTGVNSVAVEVHQAAVDSDDLSFQLELLTEP